MLNFYLKIENQYLVSTYLLLTLLEHGSSVIRVAVLVLDPSTRVRVVDVFATICKSTNI